MQHKPVQRFRRTPLPSFGSVDHFELESLIAFTGISGLVRCVNNIEPRPRPVLSPSPPSKRSAHFYGWVLWAREQALSDRSRIAGALAILDGSRTVLLCAGGWSCIRLVTIYRKGRISRHVFYQKVHDSPHLRRPAQVPMDCQPNISGKQIAVVCNTLQLRIGIRQEAW